MVPMQSSQKEKGWPLRPPHLVQNIRSTFSRSASEAPRTVYNPREKMSTVFFTIAIKVIKFLIKPYQRDQNVSIQSIVINVINYARNLMLSFSSYAVEYPIAHLVSASITDNSLNVQFLS